MVEAGCRVLKKEIRETRQEEIYLHFHYSYFIIFYYFSGPCDHLIKKDCCFKTIYEVLYKYNHVFFSNSYIFITYLIVAVLKRFYSVDFYDYTSRLAVGNFTLCFPMHKKSFSLKVVCFLVHDEVIWL